MKRLTVFSVLLLLSYATSLFAQTGSENYIEVTGSAEFEIVPDEIHFLIQIKEYWKEEYEKKSKQENYKTKVPISVIEKDLMNALQKAGIHGADIRTLEIGDYWRERGKDFLIAKSFDLKLNDVDLIDKLIRTVDTKGIQSMRIGELKNQRMGEYRKQGNEKALMVAVAKAEYLVKVLGKELGEPLRVVESPEGDNQVGFQAQYSNVVSSDAVNPENFRTIKWRSKILVRFEIR